MWSSRAIVAGVLVFVMGMGSPPALGHLKGPLRGDADVRAVKRSGDYVTVRGRAQITDTRSGGGISRLVMCTVVAKVKGAGRGEDSFQGTLRAGKTKRVRWAVSIPDPDGRSARSGKARLRHCH